MRGGPPGAPPRQTGASDLEQPVQFAAQDSLVLTFDDAAGDRGALFGSARVTYGDATLDAYRVDVLFDLDELRASGLPVDTGMVGRPTFAQGSERFQGEALAFNLRTERGRVVGAQTAIEDGFLRAGVVKVTEDSTLYVADGVYTTCDCGPNETPSYSLRADRMKVVDGEWIYTGPIRLYLFNIPTPLWLPFGFLPAKEGRRSGPLPPQYGEDERGFYLRNWGWYQAISDYMDAQVQFGFWTRGSWQVNPLFRYARRYRYSGQLHLDYVRNRQGERTDPNLQVYSTSSLRWTHQQTIDPSTSFNANVNLSSQNYLRTISDSYRDRVTSTVTSGINFSKQWRNAGRSLTAALNQRQVLATGHTDLTLPSLSFNQNARKPFARAIRPPGQDERWYEKITYNYSSTLSNRFSYAPHDSVENPPAWYDVLFDPEAYRRVTGDASPFDFTTAHRVSSSASFAVDRVPFTRIPFRLNVSPSLSYTEDWFIRTDRRGFVDHDDSTATPQRLVTESVSDWLALRQFSTSLSANTTFYGIFPVRVGHFQGLRHTVRPSLAFTYRPDFSDPFWGYTRTYTDTSGQQVRYPIVSGVQRGRQQSVSFNVDNVFETKRVEADTTGEARSTVLQLLNVNLSSSYNFAADSFRLAPVAVSARTRLFDRFDLRASASFSPYATRTVMRDGRPFTREVDEYLFGGPGLRLARLTQFSLTASTAFQSSRRTRTSQPAAATPRARFEPQPGALPGAGPYGDPYGDPFVNPADPLDPSYYDPRAGYADFAIPWSLRLDFSYGYTRPLGFPTTQPRQRAILNTGFDFNLTPNWKVQGNTGYDFVLGEVTPTQVSILRDLDCWEMSFSWVPFGRYQSYSFDIHVKSGHLRDLLRLRQPRADVRGRFDALR